MGRLLTLGLLGGAIGAVVGGGAGLPLFAFGGLLPEQCGWFVGLCAALTAMAAAIATIVIASARTKAGAAPRNMLAAVLLGGFAGAFLAARLFGDAPRGKQLIFFAVGASAAGCIVRLRRYVRGDRSTTVETASRSRWFQFTLGSLLALMVIASAVMSLWVRGPMQRAQALAAVERSGGGRVKFAGRTPDWVVQSFGDVARGLFDDVAEITLLDPTDADVARLGSIQNLRSLTIGGRRITGKAMISVAQIKTLEQLSLCEISLPSSDLAELKNLPGLRTLQVSVADDEALRQIAAIERLEGLWISAVSNRGVRRPQWWCPVTANGLAELARLDHLAELNLDGLQIGNDELGSIGGLKRLKRLSLNNTDVSDAGLAHVEPLLQLEWLELAATNVTGTGFGQLPSLSQLRRLELRRAPITDQGLEAIANLPALQTLTLDDSRITDAGMAHLKRSSKLTWLDISGTAVTDDCLPELEGLTKLMVFYHDRTKITPAGVARLEKVWNDRRAAAAERQ